MHFIKLGQFPYVFINHHNRVIVQQMVTTVYTRVQVERVYKSNPIFEAKNIFFLEKV